MEEDRRKGGRPSAGKEKIIKITLGATQDDWNWLALWRPTGNVQEQFRDMLERSRKMFPGGPDVFGHVPKKQPRKRLPMKQLRDYADRKGIRVEDAAAEALVEFFKGRGEA